MAKATAPKTSSGKRAAGPRKTKAKTKVAKVSRRPMAASRAKEAKVVIEGVPPLEVGASAVAALYSALETLGAGIPYETLSVAGGDAFRLAVQTDRMCHAGKRRSPAAGVCIASTYFTTHDVLAATCSALGIRASIVCLDRKPGATRVKTLWRDIEKSIRAGRPVPACGVPGSFEHEWCLITGVDVAGKRVFFRDATHRFELYAQGRRGSVWQGWMLGPQEVCWMPHVLITGLSKRKVIAKRLADVAVGRAVSAAREGFVRPNWASGLAAYHVWILQLGQDAWHAEAQRHLREPALANSWLLSNAFAGRRAAGQFFEGAARRYAGKKNAAVHKAAKLYSAAAGALQTAGALFPNWGQGYEEADRRHRAAELLTIAESAERDAVEGLEQAFDL